MAHQTETPEINMERVDIPGTSLKASPIALGTWAICGWNTNLRLGQITVAQEFLVSQNANLFVNSTFGWPAVPAQDLPSSGPSYPQATLRGLG
jgi:hypothetical protein